MFVIMLGWVLVLSGCAAIDKGLNIEGEYRRRGYPVTNPHKDAVSRDCSIEVNNSFNVDYIGDDRARRVYYNQCMLRNGYDADGNYVGIPPK
jgi:hypothetical protein